MISSVINGFAGAGAVSSCYFIIQAFLWLRNAFVNNAEAKAALAQDAERAKEQEIEDRIIAVVKDLMDRRALPAPTAEAK